MELGLVADRYVFSRELLKVAISMHKNLACRAAFVSNGSIYTLLNIPNWGNALYKI